MAGRRRESNREELKMRIVDTAAKAFKRLGIKAVHMDDIAGSLSISKRTLYELFGDKEQLLLEVFSFYRQCVNQDMQELTSRADNVLEVVLTFYERKVNEYPKVLDFIHEEQRRNDVDAVKYFQKGVEQGIFRDDINFQIINQTMTMQMDLLIYSDITLHYPLAEIYSEITILHMRGITTEKGNRMVDEFLKNIREKRQG